MDKSKMSVILSEGWVGPRGAKDLRADRGTAPGFVRRSFAPTPAPALSLRMTLEWFWALDDERRNPASPHNHWEFLGRRETRNRKRLWFLISGFWFLVSGA